MQLPKPAPGFQWGLKVKVRGWGSALALEASGLEERADGAEMQLRPDGFLHNGTHIKNDIISTFKGPNG